MYDINQFRKQLKVAKAMSIEQNVLFNVIDVNTGEIVQTHQGHNAATNSMLLGIGHYLTGDGVFNQGWDMLYRWVPKYISLGTMGLLSQEQDAQGLPKDIGVYLGKDPIDGHELTPTDEPSRFTDYITSCPGFGADGYDENENNGRRYFGLGPQFADRPFKDKLMDCELISDTFPRAEISYRELVPEYNAELPQTIDVVFSALVSVNTLAQFREPGKDYVFITEAGLWSRNDWVDGGDNGLLAGYRIAPTNNDQWDMKAGENGKGEMVSEETAANNRRILKESILKVKRNQVVQVIWKVQIGAMMELGGIDHLYPTQWHLIWHVWQ